jgi:hypothetical protein
MGVGANPTAWFAAVAFLIVIRFVIDFGKEANMNKLNYVKSGLPLAAIAYAETLWAIATNVVAGFVTLSIHQKGAPRSG